MTITEQIKNEFNLKLNQVENVIKLIDDGNTIPFIARYRKEMTGSLDDQVLREFLDRLNYLRNLHNKKEQVINLIKEQGNLTKEISDSIHNAKTVTEVDDIYRPFRPKKRTRSTIAKEKGLEPLANLILEQNVNKDILQYAKDFIDTSREVLTAEDALNGAKDIIAEIISDNPNYRAYIRKNIFTNGNITSKNSSEEKSVYEMYYNYTEPIKKIVSHRVLALNRGEKDGFLNVKIDFNLDEIINFLEKKIVLTNKFTDEIIKDIILDSYKRLIFPSIEREIRNELTEKAENSAIKVFGENLKQLLLQSPIKDKVILAIDPAFRTGCKIALIDEIGKVIDTSVIYPTKPNEKIEEAKEILKDLIYTNNVDIICIGNGTASRETEKFIADFIKELDLNVSYIIVNEAGASVYSASKLAAEEFPDFDVSMRSAVSIGRRLQDPLAELVKIDPKSIGIGQYQHDMNQKRLSEMLGGVVEDCVNSVGIDLNTSSISLLQYVSGVSSSIAKSIVKFREENGKFISRSQLLKVKKLGPKTFEQCAGFLRITDGIEVLDNTGVHPESYSIVQKILTKFNISIEAIKNTDFLKKQNLNIENLAQELEVGVPTLIDIIKELEKPGRDPRHDMPKHILKQDIMYIEDLKTDTILKGTVRNITDFGAFIDIGVHQDGLVHISEMTERFIKHPLEVVSVGQIIDVKIKNVDIEKNKIFLTMKF